MALDEKFIPLTSINEYFVDKDSGLPLANGTLEFYRDTNRNTTKNVYQLVKTGGVYEYTALPNPVNLNAVGTAQNSGGDNVVIFAYPYEGNPGDNSTTLDLYYIICKDSAGNVQFTRQAVPYLNESNDPVGDANGRDNMLANPQFTRYFLEDDMVSLTVSGSETVYPIAPDWDLIANGTGTVTVERVAVDGNEAIPTSPAYYLKITPNANITQPRLRQRLHKNSGLWSGSFLSGFIVAQVESGSNALTMKYQDSSGVLSDETIFSASLTTTWSAYGGSVDLDDSTNTQSGEDAYVDIVIELPLNNVSYITSIQVMPTDRQLVGDVSEYQERSANREQALMGDYYIPKLEYKNVSSLLIGWDFPVNPRQFGTSGSVSGGTASYIWDQTILQTSSGLTVNYDENAKTYGLSLNHQNADKAFALIQYLDNEEAAKVIGTRLSVNINGYTIDGGSSAQNTEVQVKLFANAAANQFPTLATTLFDLADDGTITLTSAASGNNWYEITRSNLNVAKGTLTPLSSNGVISEDNDIGFNNWVIEDNTQVSNGVLGFAIAVSFVPTASTTDYETQIDSISVTPGDIPTRPAPLSFEQTLKQCEYYWEKSYETGTSVGTASTTANALLRWQSTDIVNPSAVSVHLRASAFGFEYKTVKRASPTITLYTPGSGGGSNSVFGRIFNGSTVAASGNVSNFSTNWTETGKSTKAVHYLPATTNNLISSGSISGNYIYGAITFHYRLNARIGG